MNVSTGQDHGLTPVATTAERRRTLVLWPTLLKPSRLTVALLAILAILAILAGASTAGPARGRTVTSSAAVAGAVRFIHVNGAKIAYRDNNPRAKGTPLVMIVGYGATMAEWAPALVQGLDHRRRVIMFDNRGAGASTGSVKHLSIRLMAGDAAGVIRGLKLRRADVLGWSMGGFIAQELTLDHPGIVRRLILASTDPGSPKSTPAKPAVERTLTDPTTTVPELLPILFPSDQTTAAHAWLAAIASQAGIGLEDFTVSATTKAAQKTATHKLWLARGEGTYARLPMLRARTLVAYGTDDVIVAPSNAQILLKRIPRAQGLRVPNAGHAFLFQDPVGVEKAFNAFLGHGS